jgi:hypothetical protein
MRLLVQVRIARVTVSCASILCYPDWILAPWTALEHVVLSGAVVLTTVNRMRTFASHIWRQGVLARAKTDECTSFEC